jgi:hypothetical protein
MLKLNLKSMGELFTSAQIEDFITKNFFNLKTSDVIKLRALIKTLHEKSIKAELLWDSNFKDKQSIFSLAVLRLKQVYGDDIHVACIEDLGRLTDKQYDSFWEFCRKISEYKSYQKSMSLRAKRKYLTTHK